MTRESGPLRPALMTFVALVAAGVVGGVLWLVLWDPPVYAVIGGEGGLDEVQLSRTFTSDAWYAVIAWPLAFAVALLRRRFSASSGLLDLTAALLGSAAAASAMYWTGHLLGPSAVAQSDFAGLPEGATVAAPLTLYGDLADSGLAAYVSVVMIAWPLGVLAGWVAELLVPSLEPPAVRRQRAEELQHQPAPKWWRPQDGEEQPVAGAAVAQPYAGFSDEAVTTQKGSPPAPPG